MMTIRSNDTILCNTTMQVMGTITWKRAVSLVLSGTAYSIKDSEEVLHSQSFEMFRPEIVVLNEYVSDGYLFNINDSDYISSDLIKERDNMTCAYCGVVGNRSSMTMDHIIPQSRGGSSRWDNLITSCSPCNNKKRDKLLTEIGWTLLFEPREVTVSSRYTKHQKFVYEVLEGYVA